MTSLPRIHCLVARRLRFSLLALPLAFVLGLANGAFARPAISPILHVLEQGLPSGESPLQNLAVSDQPGVGPVIDLIVSGSVSDAELSATGAIIGTSLPDGTRTIRMPVARFAELRSLAGLSRITASYKCEMFNNSSVPTTNATPGFWTHTGAGVFSGNAGAGVVVGMVDSGIDWSHDDFKKPDGTTRILNLWDQVTAGAPPAGFVYGTEWSSAQINANACTHHDTNGHGTHVIGSAAGDGSATGNGQPAFQFMGMAPKADLIVVASDLTTAHVIDGVNYIFQKAAALGKPAVVNLSIGTQFGAHDGTETFDTSLNALTGAGKIICAAAGNEGGAARHARMTVPGSGSASATFNVPAYTANAGAANDIIYIDAYYPAAANCTVTLVSPGPSPTTVGPVALGGTANNAGSASGNIYVENGFTPSPSGDRNVFIQIYDSTATRPPRAGTWTITLTATTPTAALFDAWQSQYQLGAAGVAPAFVLNVDEHVLVASPGSAAQVITAASYITKASWPSIDGNSYSYPGLTTLGALASYSSPGPLRNNAQKPDIAGPGSAIVSAKSIFTSPVPANPLINPDGQHLTETGTSMACPHVTGACALLLATTPTLTPAQIKTTLQAQAVVDGQTGAVPNSSWGYGKLRLNTPVDGIAPTVTVNAPNGGENWAAGSVHAITWTATDNTAVTSITLEYSTNNGGAYTTIATGEANDGTYSWTLPQVVSSQVLVRVKAFDAAANTGSDVSNAVFTISDQTLPTVTVLAPNGGENWAAGSVHAITWTATDNIAVTSITLEYSTNNGGAYTTIATGEANDGTYSWTLPQVVSSQVLVRVKAFDAAANTGSDVSNAVFAISDQTLPTVTVTSPNGGESWLAGSLRNITWTASDNIGVSSITLEYSTNNGGAYTAIATGEANDGTYAWTVPNTLSTQALVRVKALDAAANTGSDVSNAVFSIVDGNAPVTTVTSPNGGEIWAAGSLHNITWTATDNIAVVAVTLEYSLNNGGAWTVLATGEANDGSYPWTLPQAVSVQALVRVTAFDNVPNPGTDVSNAVFTIADQSAPSVTVTAPNGGENWTSGDPHAITWTAGDNIGVTTVDIAYSIDGGANWLPVATGEANDGAYNWVVPNSPSTNVLVRVTAKDAANNSAFDVSNAAFTISAQSAVTYLPAVLTRPMVLQNRPNPFNPTTRIGFGLPVAGHARLVIFTAGGRLVRTLADGEFPAGYSEVEWDGRDAAGVGQASGIYFYRFQSGAVVETRRLVMSK